MGSANLWWQRLRQSVRVGMPSLSILLRYDNYIHSVFWTSFTICFACCITINIKTYTEEWYSSGCLQCGYPFLSQCRMAPIAHWRVAVQSCEILLILYSIHTLILLMNFVPENQKEASHWISSKTSVSATSHTESFSVHWVDCYLQQ